jgi:hypothetical protein
MPFVMDYSKAVEFGVDEIGEDGAFEAGYRFTSNELDKAAQELHRLLQTTK